MNRARLAHQTNYWKQQLAGSPWISELPLDHPRPPRQTFHGGSESFDIAPDLARRIRHLTRKSGGTLFMTLLAAFKTLIFRHTGQEDLLIGFPIANRNREETESLIGFFANTLAERQGAGGASS